VRGWSGNVVAMGLASGFLEPLESTSIFLIQAAVIDLVNLMPTPGEGDRMDPRLVAEFNRLFEIQYDRVRDFLILHYRANSRFGEPLWDHVRTMDIPDSLAAKMELFERRAALPDYKYGLFSRDSWLSVLEGQGLTPRAHDRLAESLARRPGGPAGRPQGADRRQCRDDDERTPTSWPATRRETWADRSKPSGRCRDGRAPHHRRVGRDAALWLSACVLRAALRPAGISVTAVELPTHLTPADVHASLPPLEALHGLLGLDEAALLRATRGAFSLGQNFADVSGATPAFFHAHGAYGAPIDNRDFFPFWLKARGLGLNVALDAFSLTAAAARQGRMLLPDEETEVFGRTDYGYHLPALAYAAALKGLAGGWAWSCTRPCPSRRRWTRTARSPPWILAKAAASGATCSSTPQEPRPC
jgi:hypothetical protein